MFRNRAILYILFISIFIAVLFPLINIFSIYPSFTHLLIENTENDAVRLGNHLARNFFKDNKPLSPHEIHDHADSLLKDLGLTKLKIFSSSGEVIYSTDPKDIGQINTKDYFYRVVAAGKSFTKIAKKDSWSLEGQAVTADVVETYVPVMTGNRFIGAFEIYYDVTLKNHALNRIVIKYSIIPFALMCGFLLIIIGVLYKLDRSITERKRAEEALQTAHDELEQKVRERTKELKTSSEELQKIVFIASHDLQEPLRKVIMLGDMVKSGYAGTAGSRNGGYIERMQKATVRMQSLIEALYTYSSVTANAQPFASVDLASLTREVLSRLKAEIDDSGGRVEVGNLPSVEADPSQMQRLLENLIQNAVKFRKQDEPPVVRVYGRYINGSGNNPDPDISESEHCEICIKDNGIGFDEKYTDRIFNVFQRLHGGNKYKGTGIGLSVCKKIAERHGGSINAKSAPGEGATFIVTLPVKHYNGGDNG